MSFARFKEIALAALVGHPFKGDVYRKGPEWVLRLDHPTQKQVGVDLPIYLHVPVRREAIEGPADVVGFVEAAVGMAKEEFAADNILAAISANQP
jgi:hypothetical protein